MHSSLIGKIEKANRYARETDRISFEALSVSFRGDNDTHRVSLEAGDWQCTCHYFESFQTACVHILAIEKILGDMIPASAQRSLFASTAAPETAGPTEATGVA